MSERCTRCGGELNTGFCCVRCDNLVGQAITANAEGDTTEDSLAALCERQKDEIENLRAVLIEAAKKLNAAEAERDTLRERVKCLFCGGDPCVCFRTRPV